MSLHSIGSHSKKIGGFERYEVESAADTLIRAKEIEQDKKLFPLAVKMVKEKADVAMAVARAKKGLAETFTSTSPRRKS